MIIGYGISAGDYSQMLIREIEMRIVNGKGVVSPFEYPLPGDMSIGNIKHSIVKGDTLESNSKSKKYIDSVRKILNKEIDISIKMENCKYYSDSGTADLSLIITPSPLYSKERFNSYYSQDFENRLINNRVKELQEMEKSILYHKNDSVDVRGNGLYIYEVGYIIAFSKFGLKDLNLSQRYTLAKVLVDKINNSVTDRVFYVGSIYERDYSSNQDVIKFYIHNRYAPQMQNNSNLSEW